MTSLETNSILLVWPVHREDWLSMFKSCSSQFDFYFLGGISSGFIENDYAKDLGKTIYWNEYTSTYQLLESIKPSKVVFMSIDSGLAIALNLTAKRLGIQTLILQHGIYTTYKDYRGRERLWKKRRKISNINRKKTASGFSSFRFIRNSLRLADQRHLISIMAFAYFSSKKGLYWASKHLPLTIKRADKYVCFSPFNATIHREVDRIREDQIVYTGSPELDTYLKTSGERIAEPFYLHIDQAMAENSFGEETVKSDKMIDFYLKLNQFCRSQSARLYIKLHPESYTTEWLPQDDNITYLRKVSNLNAYIQSARGCFGFYSTLVIPAIFWKNTVLFKVYYSGLQEEIDRLGLASVLDFWSFEPHEIRFEPEKIQEKESLKTFFYKMDGQSLERIGEVLSTH